MTGYLQYNEDLMLYVTFMTFQILYTGVVNSVSFCFWHVIQDL